VTRIRSKKYSSRVGELYKEELARRVEDDVARRFPNGIVVGTGAPAAVARDRMTFSILGPTSDP